MRRIAFVLGMTIAAITGAAACSSKSGGTTSTGTTSGSGGATSTYATSCLGMCVSTACKAQIDACNGDPTCSLYFGCLEKCPVAASGDVDLSCVAQCPSVSGSAGTTAKNALDACREQAAGADCASCGAGTGGAASGCPSSPALNQQCSASTQSMPCIKCQYEHCCDSVDKVFNGGPATDFADCWQMCNDLACVKACATQYPDGVQGFGEYDACLRVECEGPGICTTMNTCAKCAYQKCACEYAACKTDPDCFLIIECQNFCTTPACTKACIDNASGPGADLAKTYGVCAAQRCISECGG